MFGLFVESFSCITLLSTIDKNVLMNLLIHFVSYEWTLPKQVA